MKKVTALEKVIKHLIRQRNAEFSDLSHINGFGKIGRPWRTWSDVDTLYLILHYRMVPREEIVRRLKRTWISITAKVTRLNIKFLGLVDMTRRSPEFIKQHKLNPNPLSWDSYIFAEDFGKDYNIFDDLPEE